MYAHKNARKDVTPARVDMPDIMLEVECMVNAGKSVRRDARQNPRRYAK